MQIRLTLAGTTPLLHHNPQMVDPQFEIVRQIKALTGKRKKTDDDLHEIERLEWYGGIYLMANGNGASVVSQPQSKIRKCLIETARIKKLGKNVERALNMSGIDTPLIYDGPKVIDDLFADKRFTSRLPVGVGRMRVMRVRPSFMPWKLVVDALFVEDAGLNFDELEDIVKTAGVVSGIGDNRVNGYGRFTGSVTKLGD